VVAAAVATAIVAADRGAGIVVDMGGLGRGADDRGSDRVVTAFLVGLASDASAPKQRQLEGEHEAVYG
jgi:hypothetical protein